MNNLSVITVPYTTRQISACFGLTSKKISLLSMLIGVMVSFLVPLSSGYAACDRTPVTPRRIKRVQNRLARIGKRIRVIERKLAASQLKEKRSLASLERRAARLGMREILLAKRLADLDECEPALLSLSLPFEVSYSLVNAESNTIVEGYEQLVDGQAIDLDELPSKSLSIVVNAPSEVGSVRFILNTGEIRQTESKKPFALLGDKEGNYNPWVPDSGAYSLEIMLYSQSRARGTLLGAETLDFTFTAGTVSPATPIPTPTNTVSVPDNDEFHLLVSEKSGRTQAVELDKSIIGGPVYIFSASQREVSSIDFYLDEASTPFRTERLAPYDFAGGTTTIARPFDSAQLADGIHTIRTVITEVDKSVSSFTTSFFVANGSVSTPTPTAVPTPVVSPTPGNYPQVGMVDGNLDLVALHFDHAPDRDDGHSAAADRSALETIFDCDWLKTNAVAVSGTYGTNFRRFDEGSKAVMDAVFNPCGGWLDAHNDRALAVNLAFDAWKDTLEKGGDIIIKEGGQSDFTAAVLRRVIAELPEINTENRVHLIQHSNWNEGNTDPAALELVKRKTDYITIPDQNTSFKEAGGDADFEFVALSHPVYGSFWEAAFDYYSPSENIDFSDTGELLFALGFQLESISDFRVAFLER